MLEALTSCLDEGSEGSGEAGAAGNGGGGWGEPGSLASLRGFAYAVRNRHMRSALQRMYRLCLHVPI